MDPRLLQAIHCWGRAVAKEAVASSRGDTSARDEATVEREKAFEALLQADREQRERSVRQTWELHRGVT